MEFAVNRRLVRLITPPGRFSSGWSAESGRSPGDFFWGFCRFGPQHSRAPHPKGASRKSATPFGETHRRHILHGFLAIHRGLEELESLTSQGSRSSPFSQYVHDLSPTEVRVLLDHFARIRAVMLAHLEELAIPVEVRRTSVRWALQTRLIQVQVGIDDMGLEQLKGYGPLDDSARAAAMRIQDDLSRLLDRTMSYLTQGLGRDLSERSARLDAGSKSVGSLTALERIITSWQLVEYRPTLDMIVKRLEKPCFRGGGLRSGQLGKVVPPESHRRTGCIARRRHARDCRADPVGGRRKAGGRCLVLRDAPPPHRD